MFLILCLQITLVIGKSEFYREHQCERNEENLKLVVEKITEEIIQQTSCIVFITDSFYRTLVDIAHVQGSSFVSKYEIALRDNEQFSRPRKRIQKVLIDSKAISCGAYVILTSNGFLTAEFLQYTESQRLINTHGLFLLLYDHRLFQTNLHHLWNKIINVVFVRQYNAYMHISGKKISDERIDLNTVYFPAYKETFTATKYIDTWYRGKLRYGTNHFTEKTTNLQNKHLRIAVFEHIPAVTKKSRSYYNKRPNRNTEALGIEFEIISEAMNFKPQFYMPYNIVIEKWGTKGENQTYTGLINESIQGKAAFYLGDLYYTLSHLSYFDLTIPYNTECLTFLTPESLTENSWKLLILSFKLYTWIALLFTLFFGSVVFYYLSLSYEKYIVFYKSRMHIQTTSIKNETKGLYLFTEIQNSILYTYSMLFQVSLPNLPNSWAVRILIGWWWIYSILVAVEYRASMTATLADPVARVTIDTLAQLAKSSIEVGGWNEESKEFFLISSDFNSQKIGNKFRLIVNEEEAIEKVVNGSLCYYENSYLLRHVRVKRQIIAKQQKENKTMKDISLKHNLHIMEECALKMPIAIGMEKNSPLKPRVDNLIRHIIETGLVEKWLSDVMEWSKIMEIRQETESEKALVNLHKLQDMATGKRITLTIQQRLDVLQDLKTLPIRTVATKYKVHPMTIRRIKSNASNIIQFTDNEKYCKCRQRLRRPMYEQLEQELLTWFIQKRMLGDFISDALLLKKATEIKDTIGSCSNFKVSKGWLIKFKHRHNIQVHHTYRNKGCADKNAVTIFINKFKKLIKEENINLENVYNMGKSGLLWKALPTENFIGENEKSVSSYKLKKERITIVLCSNATGTHKLKPFIIHKYKKPKSLKDHMDKLPVVFKSQRNAWMDQNLFIDWYNNYFKTSVATYQLENGIIGKVLLLLDTGHKIPDSMDNENFKIMYLPANTTSLIHRLDQGMIEKTKRCFRHKMMQKVIQYEKGIQEFYKHYTIKDCIDILIESWEFVTTTNIRNAWNKIILQATIERGKEEPGEEEEDLLNEIQDAMLTISKQNISRESVTEFLQYCNKEETRNSTDGEIEDEESKDEESEDDEREYEEIKVEDKSEDRNEERIEDMDIDENIFTKIHERLEDCGIFYTQEEKEDLENIFQRLEYYSPRVEYSTQLHMQGLKLKFLGDPKI
ncbi:ionotropic receptor 68a isoform X2 [Ptiloglossa arizonensis]|uniref:ionotropic receptor 68a isoform X2 n=1 Tax=Ptiloglossa arizonensis TaxID=3350558 RepID=UPI003FA18DC7